MLKGGLVLIWELDMNLGPTLVTKYVVHKGKTILYKSITSKFLIFKTLSWIK